MGSYRQGGGLVGTVYAPVLAGHHDDFPIRRSIRMGPAFGARGVDQLYPSLYNAGLVHGSREYAVGSLGHA